MSIRARLVIMCLVVALLPAIPLTILVQSLLDKSFNLGLNSTVEDALQGGVTVSREHFDLLRERFQRDVRGALVSRGGATVRADDKAGVSDASAGSAGAKTDIAARVQTWKRGAGVIPIPETQPGENADESDAGLATRLPEPLQPFAASPTLHGLLGPANVLQENVVDGVRFFESDDRRLLLALAGDEQHETQREGQSPGVLIYEQTSADFLMRARGLIEARQIFAQLRLTRPELSRSFFYPFVVIYLISVAFALALALLMAERIGRPIRRLADGTQVVAAGDLTYQLDIRAGGETGRLVRAFNTMVGRLDAQRRRLATVEKMAAWRDVARHLAHEIKNPLLPIRLTVEELKDQYHGDDAKYRSMLDDSTRVVGEELDHLQALVKEFSAFAKMPELTPRMSSLEQLLRDVSSLYPQVGFTLHNNAVGEISFDPDHMRRVIINLFDNVVSVTPQGGATVNARLFRCGEFAVLEFSDNGPGIPTENLERVFEPYFTTRAEGTGLGLAMSRNIVLLHGGNITVTSGVGNGATFVIELPLAGPPSAEPQTDTPINPGE